MKQNQQRRLQTAQRYYKAAEKYKNPMPEETWERLKYDIRELRLRPGKLAKRYKEKENDIGRTGKEQRNARREELQGAIRKSTGSRLPAKRENQASGTSLDNKTR